MTYTEILVIFQNVLQKMCKLLNIFSVPVFMPFSFTPVPERNSCTTSVVETAVHSKLPGILPECNVSVVFYITVETGTL